MTELQRILASLTTPGVLATVVNVEGSAYRRPGARMFVTAAGDTIGTISGGCLEADVIERAWSLTDGNQPHLIRYDSRVDAAGAGNFESIDDDWGFGMGCNGAVDVLLERIDPQHLPEHIRFLQTATNSHRPVVVGTVFSGGSGGHIGERVYATVDSRATDARSRGAVETLHSSVSTVREIDGTKIFFEFIAPPPVLLICGAGHDAIPLSRLAVLTGWSVYVADRRESLATVERFPQADGVFAVTPQDTLAALPHPPDAAVVMTHRYPEDVKLLATLAASAVKYVGVLGPRHRTDRLLRSASVGVEQFGMRLHAPVGLNLGGETPEEIALAILAEATAAVHGREGGKLRDSGGPIHTDRATDERATSSLAR